jgi:hypothetical protein
MARKSRGFAELLGQRQSGKTGQVSKQRLEQAEKKGIEKLERKLKRSEFGSYFKTVANPEGEAKMSEVLEDFVEPYLDAADDRHYQEMLYSIAVIAWNLALVPNGEREEMLDEAIREGVRSDDPADQQEAKEMINELIERKLSLFTDNQRFILDFQLLDTGDTLQLSVASTLPPGTEPEA